MTHTNTPYDVRLPGRNGPTSSPLNRRLLAVAGGIGAVATLASGLLVATVVQPRSDVSDEQFSYPWSADALVPVSLAYAVLHVLVVVGLVGLARWGLVGSTRPARVGMGLAIIGSSVLAVAELLSVLVRDAAMDDGAAGGVGAVFGLATLLSMIGFLMIGVTTLQADRWQGWGRCTPLAVGVSLTALMVLVTTPALPAGVGAYGLALTALFVALLTLDRN